MAVKYLLVQKGNPADAVAPNKFYAAPAPRSKTTVKEISKDISDQNKQGKNRFHSRSRSQKKPPDFNFRKNCVTFIRNNQNPAACERVAGVLIKKI